MEQINLNRVVDKQMKSKGESNITKKITKLQELLYTFL
jgi:hypothetical protein